MAAGQGRVGGGAGEEEAEVNDAPFFHGTIKEENTALKLHGVIFVPSFPPPLRRV